MRTNKFNLNLIYSFIYDSLIIIVFKICLFIDVCLTKYDTTFTTIYK